MPAIFLGCNNRKLAVARQSDTCFPVSLYQIIADILIIICQATLSYVSMDLEFRKSKNVSFIALIP